MFGFQIYQSPKVKIWGGPHVVTGIYVGDRDDSAVDEDAVLFEFGAGGIFGVNYHSGQRLTISTVVGVTFSGYAGYVENFTDEDDITGDSHTVFFNLSFLVRSGPDAS